MSHSSQEQRISDYIKLLKAIDISDYQTYNNLILEMAQIGQPVILPIIEAIYGNGTIDVAFEQKALPVLRHIEDENAADTLVKLLKDFKGIDCGVVYAAARGLFNLIPRTQAFEALLRALSHCYAMGVGAIYSPLTKYGEWARWGVLKAVTTGDEELQAGGFLALNWFIMWGGWKSDLPMLIAALKTPRLTPRLIAIDAIAELKDMSAIPFLEEIQKKILGNVGIRELEVKLLVKLSNI